MTTFDKAIEEMIRLDLLERNIQDPSVLRAMRKVPRQYFVSPRDRSKAYTDSALPIDLEQTISQPYIVALMTQLAKVQPNSKVLEIGTGSGYQAAVLAEITPHVYSIEVLPELSQKAQQILKELGYNKIHLLVRDGYDGWPEEAPFDIILSTAVSDHIPKPWGDQIKEGGRIIMPLREHNTQWIIVATKQAGKLDIEKTIEVRFVPLTGKAQE